MRSRRLVRFQREVLTTPDGDDLALDHGRGRRGRRACSAARARGERPLAPHPGPGVPRRGAGWRVTALNFRSCARDPGEVASGFGTGAPASTIRERPAISTSSCGRWRRATPARRCARSGSPSAGTCCSSGWARRQRPARSGRGDDLGPVRPFGRGPPPRAPRHPVLPPPLPAPSQAQGPRPLARFPARDPRAWIPPIQPRAPSRRSTSA